MIPDAAVEAAVSAYNDLTGNLFESDYVRETMRTVIEAAAPHMLAGAWDEGERAGYVNHDAEDYPNLERLKNPYRTAK